MEGRNEEAVGDFCAITNSWDIDMAIAFLSKNNWDVSIASSEFLGLPMRDQNRVELPIRAPPDPPGVLTRTFNWIGSLFTSTINLFTPSLPQNAFAQYFQSLNLQNPPQATALPLESALRFAGDRNKLTLIYVHHESTPDLFVRNVLCSKEATLLINEFFILWGCIGATEVGSEMVARFSNDLPVVFAVIDSQTSETLGTLEITPNKADFLQFLYRFVPEQVANHEIQAMQDRVIREQQEKEFREAEKTMKKKAEEERNRFERENKEREELEYRKMLEEQEKKKKLRRVGDEPEPGENVSQITFRLPSGEKIERRFENCIGIEILYAFLETQGYPHVEIVSGFPTKVLSEGTLESEGLTPRGLVHVRIVSQ